MKIKFFLLKFINLLLIMLLPTCFVGGVSMLYISKQANKEVQQKTVHLENLIDQTIIDLTDSLKAIKNSLNSDTYFHINLHNVISTQIGPDIRDLQKLNDSLHTAYYMQYSHQYIKSLYITTLGSRYYICNGECLAFEDAKDGSWMTHYVSNRQKTTFVPRQMHTDKRDNAATNVITVYQPLKYQEIMASNISQAYYNKWLDSITNYDNQILTITDANGRILFQNQNALNLPQKCLDSNGYLLEYDSSFEQNVPDYLVSSRIISGSYGMKYYSFTPVSEIYSTKNRLLVITFSCIALSIILSSIIAYMYTLRDYKHLQAILDTFDQAEKGIFTKTDIKTTLSYDPYFGIIQNIINLFISKTYLSTQLDAKKYALSTAQLTALQYQLNPHFLFNAFQSIDLEILKITHMPTTANHMIADLSYLLRYTLTNPNSNVSVSEEIEATRKYIHLQKLRLGDSFQVIWDYDEEVIENYKVPKLLLQPLIENSITHKKNTTTGKCLIRISFTVDSQELSIKLTDNAGGMTPTQLASVKASLQSESIDSSGRHIGLKNIAQRIRLVFPHGSLKIWSKQNLGSVIIISGIEKNAE